MKIVILPVLFSIGLILNIDALANVSIRNGNFFIGYTDCEFLGGTHMKVERVYNSKSPFKGIFGWGWGAEFEVDLKIYPDGSIVVNESGGGAQNIFEPTSFDFTARSNAIQMIADITQRDNPRSPEDLLNFKKQLMNNREFFIEEWNNLIKNKKIKRFQVESGVVLVSHKFGFQTIIKTSEGYERKVSTTRIEFFNNQGKLIKIKDQNNQLISLIYDSIGNLQKMIDNKNNTLEFFFNKTGFVDSILCFGETKQASYYKYNDKGELIYSKDADINIYKYSYDAENRHNLIRILYSDRTTLKISYYNRDMFENVKSVEDRDGSMTYYVYKHQEVSHIESKLQVSVSLYNNEKKLIDSSIYYYYLKRLPNGNEYTYRMMSNLDQFITDTYYNEDNLPEKIIRNADTTVFKYNKRGDVIYKETPDKISEFEYSLPCYKISYVMDSIKQNNRHDVDSTESFILDTTATNSLEENHEANWSKFEYDLRCNLSNASNSQGQNIKLVYDSSGRIKEMLSVIKDRKLIFEYNQMDKPIKIICPAVGTLTVKYNNSGEVKSVNSDGGRKIALKISSEFQDLLEIIRPAGVTLSF